ncbi:MBL fold metallo-hydrolase [uncultured Spirosoma sp.]|uniref:MBL fold metallo-hydrolase n=1 Tax=uncultured Spirosoma sp. TaxID=278208 RepID=UPI002585BED5|nr:MBL fold metallo-hydrolase [uncultured Spirosoma sp.]
MLTIVIILAVLALAAFLFINSAPFGSNPSGDRLARIKRSPQYRAGSFQNIEPTDVMRKDASMLDMARDFFDKPADNVPPRPLPTVRTDLNALPDSTPTVVWFGHSSYLIKSNGTTILVDPVFSGYTAPVSFFSKAFPGTNVYSADDMPPIDILILTHDHYDHLDAVTLPKLLPKVKKVYTGLGVGAHLERWGYTPEQIEELDWWESNTISDSIRLTATPARHFSGRGLTRGNTLWSSFVLDLNGYRLFIGGDSGYDRQFKIIGEKFGPFDLAMLECGQYGKDWPNIHMFPEQTAQAAHDLNTKLLLPVHWGKFALSIHAWDEPINRLEAQITKTPLPLVTPQIGEPFSLGGTYPRRAWWRQPNQPISSHPHQ